VRRALSALLLLAGVAAAQPPAQCRGTLYLTIDTGWMDQAERIAAVLNRRQVRATLFVADERTFRGDTSLGDAWSGFWRARAAEGHAFASHTWRHWYFLGDAGPGRTSFVNRAGPGREVLDQTALCAELRRPVEHIRAVTGQEALPLWRAAGGRLTEQARRMAEVCGFRHVGWSPAGFLGDELDSDRHPNRALLARALGTLRDGDILVMHWGIRSRREPFALVLDELIAGLQQRGFCFATLGAP
jgi:peptidoglycan/xylan/chitin deacetylase (PgdA/CDA1 family)